MEYSTKVYRGLWTIVVRSECRALHQETIHPYAKLSTSTICQEKSNEEVARGFNRKQRFDWRQPCHRDVYSQHHRYVATFIRKALGSGVHSLKLFFCVWTDWESSPTASSLPQDGELSTEYDI